MFRGAALVSCRTLAIIFLLVLAPLYIVAQTAQPAVAKKETSETPDGGAISGRVVDERGQPLPNAVVSVRAVGSTGIGQNANTDREGLFQVNGLERASYLVSAAAPAYTTPPRDPSITPATTYRVGDSVTLTLIKGGVITGTVTSSIGEPVVALGVRVQMTRDANGRRLPEGFSKQQSTDDRGIYRSYGLPTGTYVVIAGGPNSYAPTPVNPFENDVPTYAPSSTRDTAAEISVRAGEEEAGIDIRYRGEAGRTISGSVNVAQESNPGFTITLTALGDGVAPWTASAYQPTGSRGFVFNGVGDGDYQLIAQSHPSSKDRALSAPKRVTVRGADITGIELVPRPLATVAGRVVLEESKAVECTDKRRPLFEETVVSAWHNDNDAAKQMPPFVWSLGAPVPADAEGNFVLRNLAPGDYYFITRFSAKYWYLQSISFASPVPAGAKAASKPIDATRIWTNVKPGDRLTGLTVTLAQGAASLRGRLVLGEGEQMPARLFAYLVPAEREKADDLLRFFAAPVSPDGEIALNNVAPGRYWILAQTYGDETVGPLTKLRLPNATETRAKLRREAEAAKTEIEFKPCQNIVDFQLSLKPRG
jgi:hypothetical protein